MYLNNHVHRAHVHVHVHVQHSVYMDVHCIYMYIDFITYNVYTEIKVVTSFKSSVITCPFMANVTQSEP